MNFEEVSKFCYINDLTSNTPSYLKVDDWYIFQTGRSMSFIKTHNGSILEMHHFGNTDFKFNGVNLNELGELYDT